MKYRNILFVHTAHQRMKRNKSFESFLRASSAVYWRLNRRFGPEMKCLTYLVFCSKQKRTNAMRLGQRLKKGRMGGRGREEKRGRGYCACNGINCKIAWILFVHNGHQCMKRSKSIFNQAKIIITNQLMHKFNQIFNKFI